MADDVDQIYERKQAMIILNTSARNTPKRARLREAEEWLQATGWQVTWRETTRAGDATSIAAEAAETGLPLLFVCGGDGTLSEAANGLAGSETALGVIPAGTVNLWARELDLLKKPLEAVQLATKGRRRRIDLGQAGDRNFMLMAGYGLDGTISHRVSPRLKMRFGAAAYVISALRETLRYRSSRLTLRLDGEEHTADMLMLVAGNTRRYAGITQITSRATADDGLLDVCVYMGRRRMDIMMHAARTLMQRHLQSRNVLYRRVQKLEIRWGRPPLVQIDRDPGSELPAGIN